MELLQADFQDFRNFEQARVFPSSEVTALVGPNGQGKTNALEGIYFLAALRPLRAVPRRSLVRDGAHACLVSAKVRHRLSGVVHDLSIQLRGSARELICDDNRLSAADFLGRLVAISFTPDDLSLAKGGPDARRRFLDRALLNARPSYLQRALRYAKAVKDRNRLLVKGATDAEIDAFDMLVAREGASIVEARRTYVDRIAERVVRRFQDIAHPAPTLSVRYRSSVDAHADSVEESLLESLGAHRPRDRRRGTTSVGPHLDDLVLDLGTGTARERASQGQHRALVLALKLVELEDLAEDLGEAPLLLLDDMSSELDAGRTRQLFASVRSLNGQVILSSTSSPHELYAALGGQDRSFVYQSVDRGTLSPPRPVEGQMSPEESSPSQSG